jgi:hypothetical protein
LSCQSIFRRANVAIIMQVVIIMIILYVLLLKRIISEPETIMSEQIPNVRISLESNK